MTQTADKSSLLLAPEFMARLDQLDLMSRKLLAGKMKAERRGQSVEFADYRNYVIGDDLRFIDWNIYARLEKLFLKLFLEEEDLALYILVDVSKSCDFGTPNKAFYIKQVAAALGYVGLVNYNRVHILAVADGVVTESGALRGRTKVNQMINFIDKLKPEGPSHFTAACRRFALQHRNKGVCLVLSDFFVKEGFENGLRYIAEVSITQPLIKEDKESLNAYCLTLKDYLTRRGGTYLFTSTAVPFDTLVLNYLRERGLLG